jgi:hypothetical protein
MKKSFGRDLYLQDTVDRALHAYVKRDTDEFNCIYNFIDDQLIEETDLDIIKILSVTKALLDILI